MKEKRDEGGTGWRGKGIRGGGKGEREGVEKGRDE